MKRKNFSGLEKVIFNGRWLLAPFFVGLIFGISLLLIKFFQKLISLVTDVMVIGEHDIILGVLSLIDMTLIGCLLVMIIFSGYEIFVSKINIGDHEDKPNWMGKVSYSGLKLRVIGAIVAISAIELLKTFISIPEKPTAEDINLYTWQLLIHLGFVVSGVLLAWMDRLAVQWQDPSGLL
jgi:uncharacterized protein (TIGR00645 family)